MIYDNENHLVDGEIKCSDDEFSSVNPSLIRGGGVGGA